MRRFLLLLFAAALSSPLAAQNVYFTEWPTISPDGQTVVFTYEDDLWQVPASGGAATRLTGLLGVEWRAHFSPDGKWIAFSATVSGSADVYVMPVGGGDIRQLTYHEASDNVSGWSWDSKAIYFESSRQANASSTWAVSLEGGTPRHLFGEHYFNRTHNVVEHPSNGYFYFNESWESNNFTHRKRYKGSFAPQIKRYNPRSNDYAQLTTYEGKDMWPTVDRQGNMYFLSDRGTDEYNLFKLNDSGAPTQLTSYETSIYHPAASADGSRIVFEKDYQLWVYDVAAGSASKLNIKLPQLSTLELEQSFDVTGNITSFNVSPDGKLLAFVARGELFVSDTDGKFIRHLRTNPLGRVVEVHFLKDNRTLLFSENVNGYDNWYSMPADGSASPKQHTNDQRNNRQLSMSPDRSKAVYLSGRDQMRVMDLETMESETVVTDEFWAISSATPVWAPDNKHIAYAPYRGFEQDIYIYNTATGESRAVTSTGSSETNPRFSPDGKYLYCVAKRIGPTYPGYPDDVHVYRLALQAWDAPYRSDEFEKMVAPEDEEEDGDKEEAEEAEEDETLEIDYDGLMDRWERVTPNGGSQFDFRIYQQGSKSILLFGSNHGEEYSLYTRTEEPFERTETKALEGLQAGAGAVEEVNGKFYIVFRGMLHKLNIDAGKAQPIRMNYSFTRNLRNEFEQMYHEAWAGMGENYYDENYHGINWQAMHDRYAEFLPYVRNRGNLRRLTNDLMGELNTSHFGFYSSGSEEQLFYEIATNATGILFDNDKPYTVASVVPNSPANKHGMDVRAGDVLTHVNGMAVDTKQNREKYFVTPERLEEMSLTFKRGGDSYTLKLHPVSSGAISSLRYDGWEDDCQRRVDEASNKRIAYVHMQNMTGGQLQKFLTEMTDEAYNRDAVILDLRWNTGGNVHDDVLAYLSREPYLQWKYRGGSYAPQPTFSSKEKPIVLLINEQSLSDAEMTAAGFKALGLGTIIGMETYRWIIFTSGAGLVDGSFYRLPSWGCYTLDGTDLELSGVAPDIEVNETFMDRLQGRDPQLDRAIQHIMQELR